MITNRIEELAGYRWAKDICMSQINELSLEGGRTRLLTMLERGLVQKPAGYVVGVQKLIDTVKAVPEARRVTE